MSYMPVYGLNSELKPVLCLIEVHRRPDYIKRDPLGTSVSRYCPFNPVNKFDRNSPRFSAFYIVCAFS